ncbi:amidohydrolase family protein [Acidobacteria bacterium AH-259-L09]|nr:amidohydrolase family protein [Acidobacteria bacterium AH-259-L09]
MRRLVISLGLALAGLAAVQAQPALVLVGGTVISPGVRPSASIEMVVIEGSRITQVGPDERVNIPPGAQLVDVRGKFIIPGLIDVHNHLGAGTFGPDNGPEKNLAALLTWGITTVFSTATNLESFAALKLATKANEAPYARFFSSGRLFGAKDGWGGDGYTPGTPQGARGDVRAVKTAAVDAVKLVYDDMSWLRKEPMPALQPEVMRAIIDEAHAQGLKAYVHAPILRFAKDALRAGADVLVHGIISDPVDGEFIELMRKNGAYYTATLTLYEACADIAAWTRRLQAFDDRARVPAPLYEALRTREAVSRREKFWTNTAFTKTQLPVLRSNLRRLSEAGIPIVTGTDTGVPGVVLGVSSQIELLLHVEAGLSPTAALMAATVTAARMIGRGGDLGAVEPGRQADLVVLDADPLADIGNVRRISRVIKAGRVYDVEQAR